MPLNDQFRVDGLWAPVVLVPVDPAYAVPRCPGHAVKQQRDKVAVPRCPGYAVKQQQRDKVAVLLPLQEAPPALSPRMQELLRQLLNGEDTFAPNGRRLAYRCENHLVEEVLLPREVGAGAGAGAGSPAGVLSPEGDTEPIREPVVLVAPAAEDSDDDDDLYD
jgi:hypothetical protein